MPAITAELVKDLRDRTGLQMMKCKEALVACNGDAAAAIEWLRKKGLAGADARAGRGVKCGAVALATGPGLGVAVLFGCETDFVARNDDFKSFTAKLADLALQQRIASPEALEAAQLGGVVVKELVAGMISRIGENLKIADVKLIEGAAIAAYNHGGRIGTLVAGSGDANALRTVAMHVAAANPAPVATVREQVPAELLAKEREIIAATPEVQAKPEAMRPKIVEGKLGRFFKEFVLVDQEMLLDNDGTKSVGEWAKAKGVTISGFARVGI